MLLILLFLLFGISVLKIDKNYKMIVMGIIVVGVSLLTFGLGTDYFSYEYLYNYISLGGEANNQLVEPVFAAANQIARMLNVDYHVFISVLRMVIICFTIKWINKNSSNAPMSLLLYFSMFYLVWSMSAIRQGLVLSIGLNIFFSREKNYSIIKKILVIVFLSLIHYSAMFYILVMIAEKVNWNKKIHISIMGLCLISTFLPLEKVLSFFTFIPKIDKIITYIEPNTGFFDFPSLMRIAFFVFVFIFYNVLEKDEFNKKIGDSFLLGIGLYFLMKFSEVAASRMTIYTFILIVLIIPVIYEYLLHKIEIKKISYIFSGLLLTFCSLFFYKEVSAYRDQVGYKGDKRLFSVDTIFDYNYDDYDNIYSFRESQVRKSKQFIEKFENEYREIGETNYDDQHNYMSIQPSDTNLYGIISDDGKWLIKPSLETNNSIYKNVMVVNYNDDIISKNEYIDLSGNNNSQEEMKYIVANVLRERHLVEVNSEVVEDRDFFNVIENPKEFVPYPENISESRLVKIIRDDYSYHVLQFKYYSFNLNIYLNDNLEPYQNIVFTNYRDYNSSDFLYATTYTGTIIFNKKGEIVWAK